MDLPETNKLINNFTNGNHFKFLKLHIILQPRLPNLCSKDKKLGKFKLMSLNHMERASFLNGISFCGVKSAITSRCK